LNEVPDVEGKFYNLLSPAGGRYFFTEHNAKRIDAIRTEIENMNLSTEQYYFCSGVAD